MPDYASWPRRFAALALDWAACTLVVVALMGPDAYTHDRSSSWYVLGVFALEVSLLTALAGGSFGQLLTRVRVLSTEGRSLSLLVSVARTLLICAVVPPLIFRTDNGRGLHDLWTGSAAYRR